MTGKSNRHSTVSSEQENNMEPMHATPQEQQLIFIAMAEKFVQFADPECEEVEFNDLLESWATMLPTGGKEDLSHHFMTAAAFMASLVLLGAEGIDDYDPAEAMSEYRDMALSNPLGVVGLVQQMYGLDGYTDGE